MKRILALLLACASLFLLCACGGEIDPTDATPLSFKAAASYEELKKLDGKPVKINGYMATSSPVDGSSIFLMNLPYQSCPFCVPNTSQLSNTMKVYAKKGKAFAFTNQAVCIVGRLEVSPTDKVGDLFTDEYGYQFCCRIVDATYTILKSSDLSGNMGAWQRIAESDVITDVYKMYDYLNFLCYWPSYFVNDYVDGNGETQKGFFLYAEDAISYITKDGAQWNYGYQEDYFDNLIAKIEKVDPDAFEGLEENVRKAELFAAEAVGELLDGNYTFEWQNVEKFGTYDKIYTLTNAAKLEAGFEDLYLEFSDWLSSWEL
ncbi:MAG: hypothetical protein IJ012_02315 [Clostridia bacterium]|nr:hypothetical protein [Clostridia bacterium]